MFNKKNKTEETFTPADLEKLNEQGYKESKKGKSIFERFSARRDSKELSRTQRWKRRSLALLTVLVLFLFIIWLISMLTTQWGDLVISLDRGAVKEGITISETGKKEDHAVILSAEKVKDVTNITYDWLPFKELDKKEGSYNGKNYLAYTFYLENNGKETVTYTGSLETIGASKSVDEAVRVMVYKNGKPAIYAKDKYKQPGKAEEDTTMFVNDTTVMQTETKNFKPGDKDKYTIVAWVEGNDPECVNDIMGGFIRMRMLFSIADEEEQ